MNEQAAIQNLEFLRQLIAETRADEPLRDAERLRMLQYNPPMITEPQEDRQ